LEQFERMVERESSSADQLAQLRADMQASIICPELAKTATQLVSGHGNPNAHIVFIGEAPGKNEDLYGVPFVGAAGKFLDEMLAQAGLVRADVYITNIVKYRPPNNRDPLPSEKEAFWPYLERELTIIQPIIVVTLGRHSMEYFLPGKKISEIHGQLEHIMLNNHQLAIMPLYHPAAALYNGSLRKTLHVDFAQIPKAIESLQSK
jgi:uracil-DNA glycosylase